MRSDSDIQRDVGDELRWDPAIYSADTAVAVKGGVVTLSGFVRSYSQKLEAEADAKRVVGVVAVANDIEVRLPSIDQRPDPEIARDVVAALKTDLPYSSEYIKAIVRDGGVTLEGELEWQYQRERAAAAARRVRSGSDPGAVCGGAMPRREDRPRPRKTANGPVAPVTLATRHLPATERGPAWH
ncbi:MAG: BON domain-containing protein [Steroidobacteraceae bacterium]